jgi:hypothetical protein
MEGGQEEERETERGKRGRKKGVGMFIMSVKL